ncbi:hypothetical protein ACFX13_001243 [Malus domestica]|uniref:Uncharacterized protein n=1 Tax=Malus domestica TaxID=3750 RepID=A0A498KNF9_MALDO|nr:hypothetical protein DVH24_023190 [Malus domestica]
MGLLRPPSALLPVLLAFCPHSSQITPPDHHTLSFSSRLLLDYDDGSLDFKHCIIGREEADDEVRAAGGTDAEGGAAEALEGKLALADEGASITAGLGVKLLEDLNDQLARRHVLIRSWPCIAPWMYNYTDT